MFLASSSCLYLCFVQAAVDLSDDDFGLDDDDLGDVDNLVRRTLVYACDANTLNASF